MIENEISTIIFCLILAVGVIFAGVNLWNFRKFKELKIENELLKLKLKNCEQRGTSIHAKC